MIKFSILVSLHLYVDDHIRFSVNLPLNLEIATEITEKEDIFQRPNEKT